MKKSKGLMGLTPPSIGYDGLVVIGNQRVKVSDGILNIQGKQLNVSEDGKVTDENDQEVATIKNGQMMPMQQQQQPAQVA